MKRILDPKQEIKYAKIGIGKEKIGRKGERVGKFL